MMPSSNPLIAFATMVRNDNLFLKIWVSYYQRFVPREHLFILVDGFDQTLPEFTSGCQIIRVPRHPPGPGMDVRRWKLLADFNTTLLQRFDVVVLNDVDEIIVADPAAGVSLNEAIGSAREVGVISPFPVEVVHRYDLMPEAFDPSQPILRQRPHVRVNEIYAKPCVTSVPVRWNLGGHRADFPTLNLDKSLYLFHLRFMDRDILLDRQKMRLSIMAASVPDAPVVAGVGWKKSTDEIEAFLLSLQAVGPPVATDFRFDQMRKRMISGWTKRGADGFWKIGKLFSRHVTHVVPERFRDLL